MTVDAAAVSFEPTGSPAAATVTVVVNGPLAPAGMGTGIVSTRLPPTGSVGTVVLVLTDPGHTAPPAAAQVIVPTE
jgi:hypothetical protein